MNKMSWLDLYNYLNKQANLVENMGEFNWQDPVTIYDSFNMTEYTCDRLNWTTTNNHEHYCLTINTSVTEKT